MNHVQIDQKKQEKCKKYELFVICHSKGPNYKLYNN